jgi:hypothetical protein
VSTRKSNTTYSTRASTPAPTAPRSRKKAVRPPRVHLTHFEVRRGDTVRLRVAVADDALAEVGDELGALIRRIAPSTRVAVVEPMSTSIVESVDEPTVLGPELVLSREHVDHDAAYHEQLRDHLEALFGSLCDAALDDALDVARKERDRRAEGGN